MSNIVSFEQAVESLQGPIESLSADTYYTFVRSAPPEEKNRKTADGLSLVGVAGLAGKFSAVQILIDRGVVPTQADLDQVFAKAKAASGKDLQELRTSFLLIHAALE